MRRTEEGDPQRLAETLEAVTQHRQRAVDIQPLAQRPQHPRASLLAMQRLQFLPYLALRGTDEGQRLVGENRALAVGAFGIDPRVSLAQHD